MGNKLPPAILIYMFRRMASWRFTTCNPDLCIQTAKQIDVFVMRNGSMYSGHYNGDHQYSKDIVTATNAMSVPWPPLSSLKTTSFFLPQTSEEKWIWKKHIFFHNLSPSITSLSSMASTAGSGTGRVREFEYRMVIQRMELWVDCWQ